MNCYRQSKPEVFKLMATGQKGPPFNKKSKNFDEENI
jgi:hypothetical protein